MDRINAKGHKPWIRPYIPHCWGWKCGKANASPTAWQLALMRLGTFSVANDSAKLEELIGELFSCETTIQEPICADMSCGEVGDYSLTYADPSRPPPTHGWLQKVMQIAAVFFLSLMVLIGSTSCKKESRPQPTPTTNDTIPEVPVSRLDSNLLFPKDPGPMATMWTAPRDEKFATITWNWGEWILLNIAINSDSVEYYANNPDVDIVTLMPDTTSVQSNAFACMMWTPYDFHRACDTIQKYWDYLRQHGKGVNSGNAIIYVNKYNGAQLPDTCGLNGYMPYGMFLDDSIWYTNKGYRVMRGDFNYKSSDTVARTNAQKLLGRKITKSW